MESPETHIRESLYLTDSLKGYSSPKAKLTTMVKSGIILRIRRGLYLEGDRSHVPLKTLANRIYGPSYLSFEYALSIYGLIPEQAKVMTSATYGKNKSRRFDTTVGTFTYVSIPARAYPYDVVLREEQGEPYLMASREKALCDTLWMTPRVATMEGLEKLLCLDMRMEPGDLVKLKLSDIGFLAGLYDKKSIRLLETLLKAMRKR